MRLRTLALVSGIYDVLIGLPVLLMPTFTASLFGAPPPVPVINAQLNGVFALALAVGYFWAAGEPETRRGYFWGAGVFAKGAGALLFLFDHFARASPATFLVFAVTDGTLALLSLWALVQSSSSS